MSDEILLTQLPIEEPTCYIEGNPDYNAARAFAEGLGYPPSAIGLCKHGAVAIVEPGEPPAISYIVKTVEMGFVIIKAAAGSA